MKNTIPFRTCLRRQAWRIGPLGLLAFLAALYREGEFGWGSRLMLGLGVLAVLLAAGADYLGTNSPRGDAAGEHR